MVAPRHYFTSCSNAVSVVTGERGGISQTAQRLLAPKLACLLAASTVACGGSSGDDYQSRADLGMESSALDAGLPSDLQGDRDASDSSPTANTSSDDGPTTASPETSTALPETSTALPETSTALSETSTALSETSTALPPDLSTSTVDPVPTGLDETSTRDETSGPVRVPVEGPQGRRNCTEQREESEDGCRYLLACDYFSVASKCRANENGTWACDCAGPYFDSEQAIPAADVSQVCATSASFCIEKNRPGGVTTLECDDTTNTASSDRCLVQTNCRHTTTFADGTVAVTPARLEVQCFPSGDENLYCTCSDHLGPHAYAVDGAGLEDACALMTEWCGLPPTETVSCSAQSVGGEWCEAQCGHELAINSANVRARLLDESVQSHCEQPMPGGDWYCSCSSDAPTLSATTVVSSATSVELACMAAISPCFAENQFEPVGAPECPDAHLYQNPSSCSAGSTCMQPGVTGEYSLALRGLTLHASCELADDERWLCYCASDASESELFELDATTPEPCSNAYQTCAASAHYSSQSGSSSFVFTFKNQAVDE